MPSIEIMLKEGCAEDALKACMREIPKVICATLEQVEIPMVRVTVLEARERYMRQGDAAPEGCAPTVKFYLGPGKSEEAIQRCLSALVETLHKTLGAAREEIRVVILSPQPKHFSVGGTLI